MVKKVYIVSYHGMKNAGGVERVVQYLYEIMHGLSYDIEVIERDVLLKIKIFAFLNRLLPSKVWNIFYPWLAGIYLRMVIRPNDLVITNGYNMLGFRSDILIAHGSMRGFVNATTRLDKFSYPAYYEKLAGRSAKLILAVSERVKEEWHKFYGVSASKIEVLNNCVDVNKFNLNITTSQKKTILFVGRLDENKGLQKLLVLADDIAHSSEYDLNIITNNEKNIEKFKNYLNIKIEIGLNIDDISKRYTSNSILYLPSMYEGFEMVTLEALASGVPVLGNDVGAIHELNNKSCGVFIENKEETLVEQFNRIFMAFDNISSRIQLRNHVVENYTIAIYKNRLKQIILRNVK